MKWTPRMDGSSYATMPDGTRIELVYGDSTRPPGAPGMQTNGVGLWYRFTTQDGIRSQWRLLPGTDFHKARAAFGLCDRWPDLGIAATLL